MYTWEIEIDSEKIKQKKEVNMVKDYMSSIYYTHFR